MSSKIRVRFAPSPTGPLHLGGVRTALYNYLFAKNKSGDFILRIEDTDQNRLVPGAEKYIMETLAWAGIKLDEGINEGGNYGPYRQSDRKHLYKQFADLLLEKGNAYIAFDTAVELEAEREQQKTKGNPNFSYNIATRMGMKNSLSLSQEEVKQRLENGDPYVVRIKVPEEESIHIHDIIRGSVVFHSSQLDDKVMFKSDGMPTYHLANVVDDHLMKITHVIRGEEWLPSTPIHVLLYRFLGWESTMPEFAHLPLILKPDGNGKLSKRDGDRLGIPIFPLNWTNPETGEVSEGFKERGFLPQAFVNMLAFLGWNPGTEQEIFSLDEMIELFGLEKLHKAGAKFDFEKAKWFNAEYIKKLTDDEIADWLKKNAPDKFTGIDTDYLSKAIGLVKDRFVFLNDANNFPYLFSAPAQYDTAVLSKLTTIKETFHTDTFSDALDAITEFKRENIDIPLKEFADANHIKTGDLMKFLRVSLVGELSGPGIPDLICLLGRRETIRRVENCFSQL
ncbi:MAG: glutamate--tRNA ligase [Sphingobacteriales bacterium]|nr:glutamate--tRNA ligase [Sphingobacteriales bacterium]